MPRPTPPTPATGNRKTLYQLHLEEWTGCTRCELHKTRKRMVFSRGTVPCDVVFIGEAPGKSEDVLGLPFIGPAGDRMDWIIKRAVTPFGLSWCLTNLVCCVPKSAAHGGQKTESPDMAHIEACAPRLQQFVSICRPKLVICVGAEARDNLDFRYANTIRLVDEHGSHIPQEFIVHPGWVIRQPLVQQGLAIQKSVITIINALEDYGLIGRDETTKEVRP